MLTRHIVTRFPILPRSSRKFTFAENMAPFELVACTICIARLKKWADQMTTHGILKRQWAEAYRQVSPLSRRLKHERTSRFPSEAASRADHARLANPTEEERAPAWWARARAQLVT